MPGPRLVKQDGSTTAFPEIVDKLKSLLAMAERGELLSLAFVGEMPGDKVYAGRVLTREGGHFTLVGGIEALKIALLQDSVAKLTDD